MSYMYRRNLKKGVLNIRKQTTSKMTLQMIPVATMPCARHLTASIGFSSCTYTAKPTSQN